MNNMKTLFKENGKRKKEKKEKKRMDKHTVVNEGRQCGEGWQQILLKILHCWDLDLEQ